MTDTEALARIITSAACCAAILIGSAASLLTATAGIPKASEGVLLSASTKEQETASSPFEADPPKAENSKPEKGAEANSSKSDSSASLPASTEEKVMGAIIERFISPYTASTSYNGVYLKNSTGLSINIKQLLGEGLGFKIKKSSEPEVLILHTHATETFLSRESEFYTDKDSSRTTDNSKNMVAIGKIVSDSLNAAGIKTLHATAQHDYPEYNNSYTRAAKTINSYLKKHPSIKVVIDLHRDAVSSGDTDKVKLTTEIDGKKAAQIMIVMGSQSGGVTNFPNWKENLKLALRLQQTVEAMYPSLARALSLTSKNYNESLTTGSMLIEIGTDGNTLSEAKYSAELLSKALISLFNTLR